MTRALILAAGRGSRLGEMTDDRPKCLVPIAGRPMLEWQIAALRAAGIEQVEIVGGFRSGQLAEHAPLAAVNDRWAESNMVRSLMCADAVLSTETCVISYSDIVYHPDSVAALTGVDDAIAMTYDTDWLALWTERAEDPLDDAETFKQSGGYLTEIGRKASAVGDIEGQYMGLLRFAPEGWAQIRGVLAGLSDAAVDKLDMTGLLQRCLEAGLRIRAVPIAGRWVEVDTQGDLETYGTFLRGGKPWAHDWRW